MFVFGCWARAFINSAEKAECGVEDSLNAVKDLTSWIKSLPGEISGRSAAVRLEKLIRGGNAAFSPAQEIALRFVILAVKKNVFRYIDSITREIKKLLDKKQGFITVLLESAAEFSPAEPASDSSSASLSIDESRIKSILEKTAGIGKVNLIKRVNPELISGYRLRIGDKIIDASIRSQLQQLEMCLAGDGGI